MNRHRQSLTSLLIAGAVCSLLGGCQTSPPEASPTPAQSWLAARLDVPVGEVSLVRSEQREWSDSCLGLGGPAESCLAVITPGYLVLLEVGDQQYEVRTDESGQILRSPQIAAGAPGPPGGV